MSTSQFPRYAVTLLGGLLAFSTVIARAQSPLSEAETLMQAQRWDAAYVTLNERIQEEELRTNARAWLVLGFIQKERFKASGAFGLEALERTEAVNHLQRAMNMGTLSSRDRQTAAEALDYMARTYFREAIERVEGFTLGAESEIMGLMGRYEAIEQAIDPAHDATAQRADLHRYLGQAHARLLESDRYAGTDEEVVLFEGAVSHYEYSLNLAPNHYATLYNLAITLYNHGVRQLKRINHETSMFELMEIQDACVGLFETAMVPMEMAHQQRPDRLETLKGLMTIHYALSQPDESEVYKRKIEAVLQKD